MHGFRIEGLLQLTRQQTWKWIAKISFVTGFLSDKRSWTIRMQQDNKVGALLPLYCSKHLPIPKSVHLSLIANDILCINKLRTRATTAVVLLVKWSRYTLISWSFCPVFTWQKYPRKSFWKFLATVFSMELPKHRLTPIGCFIPLKVSFMQRCQRPKSAFW